MLRLRLLLTFVFLAALAALASGVGAQSGTPIDGTYIQINNGTPIVTNPNQRPQIVVQFGNRNRSSDLLLANVECAYLNTLGVPSAVQRGPFRFTQALDEFVPDLGFPPSYDLISFGYNALTGELIHSVRLIPGQNYNVAFNIRITAPRGSSGFVACTLYSGEDVILAETETLLVVQ